MTLAKARKITGLEIEALEADGYFFVEAARDGVPVALAQGKILKDALKAIVEKVYKINSQQAMETGEFRCSRCGRITPLQAHHIVHRSQGRRQDDPESLMPLCQLCHEKVHGAKVR